jgi:hypothetical protein
MNRTIRLLVLAAALTLALAAPVHAFAGRNGSILYGWSSANEPELGPPFTYEYGIEGVSPHGDRLGTLRGCHKATDQPDVGDCAIGYVDPAVSPSGRRIAFDAGAALALMNGDGSGFRLLPAHSADDGEPAFSRTGTRVVFSAGVSTQQQGAARGVWISDVFGAHARRLTANGSAPAWSARDRIAFVRAGQVWLVRPNGHGLRRLTRRGGASPTFSPHGTQLAFSRRGAIVVLNLASSRTRTIRGTGATDLAWSPDGRRFAFHVFDGGVWIVRADGRGAARRLVAGGAGATYSFDANGVDWQPLR